MPETVVVIGGTSGMGLSTAQELVDEGYDVVLSGRTDSSVDDALQKIDGPASGHPLNFTNPGSIEDFFDEVGDHDHLVMIGSGQAAWGSFDDLTAEAVKTAFDHKFYGYFLCAQTALDSIRDDGSMIFTIGGASRSAIPGTSGVAAVNGAIEAMAMTLANELAPLRVNVIAPGVVDTPAYDWMEPEEKEVFFDQMAGDVPVERVAQPDEIAQAVPLLIQNEYATGAILDVDGGLRL